MFRRNFLPPPLLTSFLLAVYSSILRLEVTHISETLVYIYQTTRNHIEVKKVKSKAIPVTGREGS
jgi:hypothetical protein